MEYLERRHYQLLIAVRRYGQLSLAGRSLGLTQSAASHQIREAERRLGIPLFDRAGRTVRLTTAAERLLEAALYAEDTLRTAERDAIQLHRGTSPTLRIAIGNYDHLHWLPSVSRAMDSAHNDLKLEIVRFSNRELPSSIMSGSADFFIAPHNSEFDDLSSIPLFQDRLVAILPAAKADLGGRPLTPADFRDWRYIAFQYHPVHGFEYERFFRLSGLFPKALIRAESINGIIELAADGFGVSIVPQWCVAKDVALGRIVMCDLDPGPINVTWNLYGKGTMSSKDDRVLGTLVSSLRASHQSTSNLND